MGISVGLPIWHSVSADTDRDFPISAKPIIGRYTDISADTDMYRLSVRTLTFNVSNHIGQQTVDFILLLLYFEMGILEYFTDMPILG